MFLPHRGDIYVAGEVLFQSPVFIVFVTMLIAMFCLLSRLFVINIIATFRQNISSCRRETFTIDFGNIL